MPKLLNDAKFGVAPMRANVQRSAFPIGAKRLFTGNRGDLIPFYWKRIVPGDTVKIDTNAVVRMQTPLYPVFDDAVLDYYFFWIPERIVWNHFKEFIGEDTTTAWETPTEYTQPFTTAPATTGWNVGTIADYLGFRTGTPGIKGQSTLFRSYVSIWNNWFRDENLKDPAMLHTGDADTVGSNGTDYINDAEKGGMPLKAAKIKNDPFVSALPSTQKGERALLPIASVSGGYIPVRTRGETIPKLTENEWPLTFVKNNDGTNVFTNSGSYSLQLKSNAGAPTGGMLHAQNSTTASITNTGIKPSNLWADLSAGATIGSVGTIRDLRISIAIQQLLEAYARGGTRYREILASIYSVQIPDQTVQIPEYLCGSRIPINMDQVLQTSSTGEGTTPLGETGAFSNTSFSEFSFEKSFVEFGYIMGVCVIRRAHASYSQGVPMLSQRRTKYDYFNPYFVHLGEEPIYNKYIFAQGTSEDDEVFGYGERYFAYRDDPNQIMGEFRPDYAQTLDAWHYGDNYGQLPTLSSGWIDEDKTVFDRTLAVSSANAHQFMFDIYLTGQAIRPMPVHGIPGLTRL